MRGRKRSASARGTGAATTSATGLVNFRMRWYDPVTGRWLSKDPIGLSGGLNLYAFCGGNPVVCEDVLGCAPPVLLPGGIAVPGGGPNWHHKGRDSWNSPLSQSPPKGDDDWCELPESQNAFHDNGFGKPEKKFIHRDGREAVYDGDTGKLITDPDLKGTYNYVNPPKNWPPQTVEDVVRTLGHGAVDVVPFMLWGN